MEKGGTARRLAGPFDSVNGLSIGNDGREVFFTAAEGGANQAVMAVTPSCRSRVVYRVPGQLVLYDSGKDGSFVMSREIWTIESSSKYPGETTTIT